MLPLLAAALSVGANAFGQSQAASAQSNAIENVMKKLKILLADQRTAGGQQLDQLNAGLGDISGGYDKALAETSAGGFASRTDAIDLAKQQFGASQNDLINRGMFNPEMLNYARMGFSNGLARTLAGINEYVARERAGLFTQQGQALAGQRGAIAGQIGQNFAGRAGIMDQMMQLRLDRVPGYQDNSQSIGAATALLGNYYGGK